MDDETRRDRWMVARHRANTARINAAYLDDFGRPPGGIRRAIDDLDSYLSRREVRSGRGWSGDPLVFEPYRG